MVGCRTPLLSTPVYLIPKLYDTSDEVCERAVLVLDEACSRHKNLETLVQLQPSLDHLGDVGEPLLLRFLSTSTGIRWLSEISYIEKQMDYWFRVSEVLRVDGDVYPLSLISLLFLSLSLSLPLSLQEGNIRYVVQVELSIARAFWRKQRSTHTRTFETKLAEEAAKLREIS